MEKQLATLFFGLYFLKRTKGFLLQESAKLRALRALAPTRLTYHQYVPYAPYQLLIRALRALPIINMRLRAYAPYTPARLRALTFINRRLTRLCLVLCCVTTIER